MNGDFVIRTTAGVCVVLYLAACLCWVRRGPTHAATKWLWTAGWLVLVVHTAAAFHFRHDWSGMLAADHVAKRTEEVVGFYWAGGIWFNYLLLVAWGVDVARLWKDRHWKFWTWFVHAFLAMMIVSSTVVFGPAYWWIAAGLFAVIAWVTQVRSASDGVDG